jgi:type 1 glutamine amidotransferase
MKKALIIQGGWDGHQPELVAPRFKRLLEKHGFEATVSETTESLSDLDRLMEHDLLVMCWTMAGPETNSYSQNISKAVGAGMGIAGCHGGMCDSFRNDTEYQFITGGQWVSHPGGDGVEYTVDITSPSNPITEGIASFKVKSEHYYLHIDPAVEVLATTRFPAISYYHISNKPVDMPVVWTKMWGNGRVFYTSLGHHDDVFDNAPEAETIMERGMLWAAAGKAYAIEHGLTTERFENAAKMY